ncbi:hypothetical protein IC620_16020 [Hazenella sp. IB182357]|uniref:Uncharacterized protein n=1 Tax=Polycladospora coralii TaxID=2771432 RepID=A0A926NC44_9BACL|nr:hypothetical protein [Polycladospora coralii]MBD1373852.1 hypothetical protein [Polycladospora coralii]
MYKKIVYSALCLLFVFTMWGCKNYGSVIVQVAGEEERIMDRIDHVKQIELIVNQAEWQYMIVEMGQRADVDFWINDSSKDVRKRYGIWFNEDGKAELTKNNDGNYSMLDKDQTKKLKALLISTNAED